MLHQQNGAPVFLLDAADQLGQLRGLRVVQPGGGLIQDDQLGIAHQGAGNLNLFQHTVGQARGVPVPVPGQTHELQHLDQYQR